ncbi:WD40-repeat-containing domain protein [Flagelloscypha sp. PMI_526]|nr:WD40-repeat-containing domain protein [Flagelloscypha sp. PMI_526]
MSCPLNQYTSQMSEHGQVLATTEPPDGPMTMINLKPAKYLALSEQLTPLTSQRKRPLAFLSIGMFLYGGPRKSLGPVSQISIVENILSHYQFDCSEDGIDCVVEDDVRISDMFDLIIGTGTGGLMVFGYSLIACMFAVLKMTIKEAKTEYIRFYESAYRPESGTKEGRAKDLKCALENILDGADRSAVDSGKMLSCMKLKDVENLTRPCKFAVTAMTSANTSCPVLLRAYRGRSASIECTLLEALLATLSDPGSLPSVDIENEEFISANVAYLNPSEDLLREISSIFPHDTIATIVSIGPGRSSPSSVRESGFSQAVHDHAELCQAASERMLARFSRHHNLWLRFEVDTLYPDPEENWGTVVSHSRMPARLRVADLSGLEVHLSALTDSLNGTHPLQPGTLERIEHTVEEAANQVENLHDALKLKNLEVKWSAKYNSADISALHPRFCTADTCELILERIESWARDVRHYSHMCIYWITGRPGTGKSTILRTICKRLDENTLLAESYFCSVQLPSKDSKYIFPTIALRLSAHFPSFRKHLIIKLQNEPSCVYAPLEGQFRDLLCVPWAEAGLETQSLSPLVIVIDAIDECEETDEILGLMMDAVEKGGLGGLKFLISSRPIPALIKRFRLLRHQLLLELDDIDAVEVSGDIERFLSRSLGERLRPGQIVQLTSLAHGLFIFASTLVKYLLPSPGFPDCDIQRRYHDIADRKEMSLNALYQTILVEALSPESSGFKERLRVLHAISFVEEASSASVIADFIGIDIPKILSVAKSLRAVLSIPSPDDPILVIHNSFYDFIVSKLDGPFKYNRLFHHELTLSCLTQMNGLRFNICNIQSSFTMDDDLEQSPVDIIGRTLEYACQHWWEHFQKCTKDDQRIIEDSIAEFLLEKGLFWIEAMILLGNERQCRDTLTGIASYLLGKRKNSESKIGSLAFEASKMVSQFMTISPKMTSHLYLSVLSLWEDNSMDSWKQQFHRLPKVLSRRIDCTRNCMVSMNVGSRVRSVAFSPDGLRVVSGSEDNIVRIWDTQSGRRRNKLIGHQNYVNSVSFSPDGSRIVSGSDDKSVRIWDSQSGCQLNKLDGHQNWVCSVAFSPENTRIVSGSCDKSVRIWDAHSGQQLNKLKGHQGPVCSVAFSPDGSRIVSGSNDNSVRIWDAQSGHQLNKLKGHQNWVFSVAFSPDGLRIVSGSEDDSVRIWDAHSARQLYKLNGHSDRVYSVAFSPDGSRIVSGSWDHSVRIWDAQSGHQLTNIGDHQYVVTSVAFSPDGSRIVSGSAENNVRIWDAKSGLQLSRLKGHQSPVLSVAFSPDGNCIASGSSDKSVRVWDAESGQELNKLDGHENPVSAVAFSLDSSRIVSGSDDKSVHIWDAQSGHQLNKLKGHQHWVCSVAFSPENTRIVSGSCDKSVRIWDAHSGQQLNKLKGHQSPVLSVAFSPDGSRIVSGSNDNSVRIWEAQSGLQLNKLDGHGDWVHSVAFSPDSTRIVSGSGDNSVRVWDVKSGLQLSKLNGHRDSVHSVAFSPDGKCIVSGSCDRSVRIWDARSGRQLTNIGDHQYYVTSVAFSRDGSRVVSGSLDRRVRVWDAQFNQHLHALNYRILEGELNLVCSTVHFSFLEQHSSEPDLNTNSVPALYLPANSRYTDPRKLVILRLNPISSSYHVRDDGWVVTSIEETGVERKLLWLPPSLRPFHPTLLMEISESGFNGIDLSGCIFGNGWFNMFGVDPERDDTSSHLMRPVVDLKKRGLWTGNDEQDRTTFHPVKDSASESIDRVRDRLKGVFKWNL